MNTVQLLAHFDRISEAPDAIPRLRRFILDLAVRGKLVEQDPTDEPVCPKRQFSTSRQLRCGASGAKPPKRVSSGEIQPQVSDEEAPFAVPVTWKWVKVSEVAECRLGKMLDKAKNKGTPRRYLRNINVRWLAFDLSDVQEMRFEDSELDEFALRRGDVLVCEGGEPGRAAIWDEREPCIYFQKAIHRVRFSDSVDPKYFVSVLRSSADSGSLRAYFTGVGIQHLTGKGLASFRFPLPPLAEQRRIVARVDELMALCDRLEAKLATAQTESRRLLEAVLHHALDGESQ